MPIAQTNTNPVTAGQTIARADSIADFHAFPDAEGHFGRFGGRFVAETLIGPLQQLAAAYDEARDDPVFQQAFDEDLALSLIHI